MFSSIINMRRSRIEERFILPPFVQPKTNLSDVLQEVRQQPTTKEEKCWRLTVAAPLTCTDLLAVDRVPGTRSTDNCTSFGFTSVTFTSLKPTQTEDKKIKNRVRCSELPAVYHQTHSSNQQRQNTAETQRANTRKLKFSRCTRHD